MNKGLIIIFCVVFSSSIVRIELNHPFNMKSNIQQINVFIWSNSFWRVFQSRDNTGFLFRNYNESRVLPICLVLLDSQTYKHEKKDPFELGLYCSMTLHHEFLEIDELTGYDQVKEEIEREKGKYETKQLDVYLYQSEFHKNQNMKEIIEYCLSCRVLLHLCNYCRLIIIKRLILLLNGIVFLKNLEIFFKGLLLPIVIFNQFYFLVLFKYVSFLIL